MTPVRLEIDGRIATITLDDPERRNGMSVPLMEGLIEAVDTVARTDEVTVVVLTGTGRSFCAGADLSQGVGGGIHGHGGLEAQTATLRRYMGVSEQLHELPKIVVAGINGACAGGGFGLACAADLRYAAASARFATAFLRVGLPGDFGATYTLPRIVGAGKARELYLLPDPFDAQEALRIGLVSEVVADDALPARLREVAGRLAAGAPLALAAAKRNLNAGEAAPSLRVHLDLEAERHARVARSADAQEGLDAFLAKRPPEFTGH